MVNLTKTERNSFIDYVNGFYGNGEIYAHFFNKEITRDDIETALDQRLQMEYPPFDGDTVDREIVRDIMLHNNGTPKENLEYKI